MTLDKKRMAIKKIVEEFQGLCLDRFLEDCKGYEGLDRIIPLMTLKDRLEATTRINTCLGLFLLNGD
jgi:hypothetical protein